jgi:hypothetical protein
MEDLNDKDDRAERIAKSELAGQKRRQMNRQKNYSKLKQCLAEYEKMLLTPKQMNDILSVWLPAAIIQHIFIGYHDFSLPHVKLLGYISENIVCDYRGPNPIMCTTLYEKVGYSLQQHEQLKQWMKELELSALTFDVLTNSRIKYDLLLEGSLYYGGYILHHYKPDKQKWIVSEDDPMAKIIVKRFFAMHMPMIDNCQ